jgi:hypothetical protein
VELTGRATGKESGTLNVAMNFGALLIGFALEISIKATGYRPKFFVILAIARRL